MIEVISGTNRPGSNSLKVAKIIEGKYKKLGVKVNLLDLCDLPLSLFNGESYEKKPKDFESYSQRILKSKGLHVVAPEYNGSYPGALKYFIDHLPFPESFEHRCVSFTGVASGIWGGLRSVEQLQGVFGYRNAFISPERTFLSSIHKKLNQSGTEITDEFMNGLLDDQIKKFVNFVQKLSS